MSECLLDLLVVCFVIHQHTEILIVRQPFLSVHTAKLQPLLLLRLNVTVAPWDV